MLSKFRDKGFCYNKIPILDVLEMLAELPDVEVGTKYIVDILVTVFTISIMIQIRENSLLQDPRKVDKLASFRIYKSRVLTKAGVQAAIAIAIFESLSFYDNAEYTSQVLKDYMNYNLMPIKSQGAISPDNYTIYPTWRACSIVGSWQSGPNTNPKIFNINPSDITGKDFSRVCEIYNLQSYVHNRKHLIVNRLQSLLMLDKSGYTNLILEIREKSLYTSEIESELVGTLLKRINNDNVKLTTEMNINIMEKYLTKFDFIRYKNALFIGNKDIVKKLEMLVNSNFKREI